MSVSPKLSPQTKHNPTLPSAASSHSLTRSAMSPGKFIGTQSSFIASSYATDKFRFLLLGKPKEFVAGQLPPPETIHQGLKRWRAMNNLKPQVRKGDDFRKIMQTDPTRAFSVLL
jgi:hypothetical protein